MWLISGKKKDQHFGGLFTQHFKILFSKNRIEGKFIDQVYFLPLYHVEPISLIIYYTVN